MLLYTMLVPGNMQESLILGWGDSGTYLDIFSNYMPLKGSNTRKMVLTNKTPGPNNM